MELFSIKDQHPQIWELVKTDDETNLELAYQLLQGIYNRKSEVSIRRKIAFCFNPIAVVSTDRTDFRPHFAISLYRKAHTQKIKWHKEYVSIISESCIKGRMFYEMISICDFHEAAYKADLFKKITNRLEKGVIEEQIYFKGGIFSP